jgi:hypothetical protein
MTQALYAHMNNKKKIKKRNNNRHGQSFHYKAIQDRITYDIKRLMLPKYSTRELLNKLLIFLKQDSVL